MGTDARLGSVVMFVRELDRSVDFYAAVLSLTVVDRSPTAALLSSPTTQLVLRAMGDNATHPLGAVGVQYAVWTAASPADLDRSEQALKQRAAHRSTRSDDGHTVVEGRDPDDIVVMVSHPGPDVSPLRKLPARIYGW
ncbi:MAG TPA: VOC family protein [Streptosporangiaceae bacterium]|jgi:catechol 2,3-dioxygenase-like lactoylglutathione lyase family enzyme